MTHDSHKLPDSLTMKSKSSILLISETFCLRLDAADVDHSENEDISMKSPSEGDKPTRGRKRGAASGQEDKAPEPKAKRGRKKAEETEEQWTEDSSMVDTTMETEDEQNSPPKKGRRGRPPKSASAKEETAATKGRRGRRKAAPPPEEDNDGEQDAEEEEEDEDRGISENTEEVKPKGRRGRKPR